MNEFKLPLKYNWETLHKPIIKKYVADLYQNGTDAPVATVLYNDTGINFTYEYDAPGSYYIIASKDIFTGPFAQKVQTEITNPSPYPSAVILPVPAFFNVINILSGDSGGLADDIIGALYQNRIEITIFN